VRGAPLVNGNTRCAVGAATPGAATGPGERRTRKFIGRDGRAIFNTELAAAGFATAVDQPTWGAQLWPRRRLALAVSSAVEGDAATMPMVLALVANRMTDVLAFSHGGDPRVLHGGARP